MYHLYELLFAVPPLPISVVVVLTNRTVWGDMFVPLLVHNAEEVESGWGGGAWGGRIKMVSSVTPAAAKQDTTKVVPSSC